MNDLNTFQVPIRRNDVFQGIRTMHSNNVDNDRVQETNDVDMEGLECMLGQTEELSNLRETDENEIHEVDKDYLPMVKDSMVRDWVIEKYKLESATEDVINKMIQDLQDEKSQVRKLARDYVHCFLVEALRIKGLTNLRTMKEIKEYWVMNKDNERVIELMKYVMFGYFDERKNWDYLVEQKILQLLRKKYREAEGRRKGCIAKILCEEKNEKVKQIQRPCKKDVTIGIRRKHGEGSVSRNKRRKKGAVYVNINIQRSAVTVNSNNGGHSLAEQNEENTISERIRLAAAAIRGIGQLDLEQLIQNLSNGVVGV